MHRTPPQSPNLTLTDILQALSEHGRYLVREHSYWDTSLNVEETYLIKNADGTDVTIEKGGRTYRPIKIGYEDFDELRHLGHIREDGTDARGNTIYRRA